MTVNNYTDVKVCNAGLQMLGVSPINSLDDDEIQTNLEATCATLYPIVKAEILSRHSWNFARPMRQLAANGDADEALKGGYLYAYKLPSDLIAGPFAVYANGDKKNPISDYENINDHILSNAERIDVRYRSSPSENIWPMYMISLVATAFAARVAKPATDDGQMATEMRIVAFGPASMDGRGGLMGTAMALDATSEPSKTLFAQGDPLSSTRY